MRLTFTEWARADLRGIFDHIAKDNRPAASRVVSRIRSACRLLAAFPRIGRVGRDEGTREWLVLGLPYLIVYEIDSQSDAIVVVAVFHAAQNR